jgi:hypothetical protein
MRTYDFMVSTTAGAIGEALAKAAEVLPYAPEDGAVRLEGHEGTLRVVVHDGPHVLAQRVVPSIVLGDEQAVVVRGAELRMLLPVGGQRADGHPLVVMSSEGRAFVARPGSMCPEFGTSLPLSAAAGIAPGKPRFGVVDVAELLAVAKLAGDGDASRVTVHVSPSGFVFEATDGRRIELAEVEVDARARRRLHAGYEVVYVDAKRLASILEGVVECRGGGSVEVGFTPVDGGATVVLTSVGSRLEARLHATVAGS